MTAITRTPVEKEQASLLLARSSEQLHRWMTQLPADPIVAEVIKSAAFQRLRQISFLGALDHIGPTHKLDKKLRSRADHSLHVAALASFVAEKRGYSQDLKRHLIIAGLLHDIGHPPLSHSIEPYLEKTFGYGHHEMGEMLLSGQHTIGKPLKKTLRRGVDTDFIRTLIAGKASDDNGGDLFSSPINIDTIEGIIRSYRYLSRTPTALNPLHVAAASFLSKGEERYSVLDKFWKLKDFIYNNLITKELGLIADQFSQVYWMQSKEPLREEELFGTEKKWRKKHNNLFYRLESIKSKADTPPELDNRVVLYKARQYLVKPEQSGMKRYQSAKYAAQKRLSVDSMHSCTPYKQLGFAL